MELYRQRLKIHSIWFPQSKKCSHVLWFINIYAGYFAAFQTIYKMSYYQPICKTVNLWGHFYSFAIVSDTTDTRILIVINLTAHSMPVVTTANPNAKNVAKIMDFESHCVLINL